MSNNEDEASCSHKSTGSTTEDDYVPYESESDEEDEDIDNVYSDEEDELDDLSAEANIPIEELLKRYQTSASTSDIQDPNDTEFGATEPKHDLNSEDSADEEIENHKREVRQQHLELLAGNHATSVSKQAAVDESDDEEYDPYLDIENRYRKMPRVGEQYQINELPSVSSSKDAGKCCGSSKRDYVLWDPSNIPADKLERYLKHFDKPLYHKPVAVKSTCHTVINVHHQNNGNGCDKDLRPRKEMNGEPKADTKVSEVCQHQTDTGDASTESVTIVKEIQPAETIHDDEQALLVLQSCRHDVNDALDKAAYDPTLPRCDTPSIFEFWGEEDCKQFEWGMRLFGKDFNTIQHRLLPGRSVRELVNFYYIWKRSSRYAAFNNSIANKTGTITLGSSNEAYLDTPKSSDHKHHYLQATPSLTEPHS